MGGIKAVGGNEMERSHRYIGWQPIETAPKDGTPIDIRATENESGEYRRLCNCKWGEYAICGGMVFEVGWIGTHHQYEDYTLTGWMHLPPE